MYAYVFWHWPQEAPAPDAYVDALERFHSRLQAQPPAGYHGSAVFEVEAPWIAAGRGYEDWYLVESLADLEHLNRAAVDREHQDSHDEAAKRSLGGSGGLYALAGRDGTFDEVGHTTWFWKPRGVPYDRFVAAIGAPRLWIRQLVLGPAPELCALGPGAPRLPAEAEVVPTVSRLTFSSGCATSWTGRPGISRLHSVARSRGRVDRSVGREVPPQRAIGTERRMRIVRSAKVRPEAMGRRRRCPVHCAAAQARPR